MKKKLLLLLLTFAMVLPIFSSINFVSYSEEIPDENAAGTASIDGGATAVSFKTALSNVSAGGTVTLLQNIKLVNVVSIGKNITIDGNGKSVSFIGNAESDVYAFAIRGNVTFKRINIYSKLAVFNIAGGTLNLGELGQDEKPVESSKVTVTVEDTTKYTILFTADNSTLNSYCADITAVNNMLSMNSKANLHINFHSGRYEITTKELANGGRLIQGYATGGEINVYGGSFISHDAYTFNLTTEGTVVNIYDMYFEYTGSTYSPILIKNKTQCNIYGGIFYSPNYPRPISSNLQDGATDQNAKYSFYGGTVITKGEISPVGTHKDLPAADIFALTYIDAETLADVDVVDFRPVLNSGAAVSLDPNVPGIKFSATMPQHAISSLEKLGATSVSYGMLIAPTLKLQGLPFLNNETIKKLGLTEGEDYVYIDADSTGTNKYGGLTFSAALTGVDERYFGLDYSAVPYVRYTKNGRTVYLFGNFSEANTRNMKDIATRALANYATRGGVPGYTYTETQIDMLEKYANAAYDSENTSVARVLSLNVLTTDASNGYVFYKDQSQSDYTYGKRLLYIQAAIKYAKPDVMLFQEYSGQKYWGTVVKLNRVGTGRYQSEQFPGYEWVNHGDRRGTLYENNTQTQNAFNAHNFVIYSTDKFTYSSSGTRFVSKDGTYPITSTELQFNKKDGAQGDFDDLGDFTWVVLIDKATGQKVIYASIHTYNNGLYSRYAYFLDNLQCVTAYLQTVSEANGNCPVVIGGDFNMSVYNDRMYEQYDHMTKVANYTDAGDTGTDYGTARDFGASAFSTSGASQHGVKIDYIFANGVETYGYEVLTGKVVEKSTGVYEYDPYAKVGTTTVKGEGYDISDHLPIMTDVIIRTGATYQKENTDDYYTNPNTKNDTVKSSASGTGSTSSKLVFDSTASFNKVTVNTSLSHGSQYVRKDIVTDATKGDVLRISTTDETNFLDVSINTQGLSSGTKLKITYKTEITYSRPDKNITSSEQYGLRFTVNGSGKANVSTEANGEWKTAEITVSGSTTKVGIYGRYQHTGLLNGDAIYIASIEITN